jgi:DNA (cytosine-5)-methyltransferase 1
LENVKGLVNHDSGNTWRVIQETLEGLDYSIHAQVLDAADYGVPQHRERIYIVGFDKKKAPNGSAFNFPAPAKERVDIGQYIETGVDDRSISKRLQSNYLFKKSDGRPEILTPQSTGTVKTLVASYHKIQRLTGTFVADGPTGLRLLSENECKAIMGFPADFKVPVSRTQMYRQFGNSVAVPVIELISKEISKALKSRL